MSFYKNHLFFCLNERDDGGECCSTVAAPLFEYAKKQAKALDLHGGRGKARINRAGCLNRCEHGPVCVVYPSATWYTFIDEADIDEILSEHLQHGREVKRLKIA
jgi:(2Fe-2S) ferredoxin